MIKNNSFNSVSIIGLGQIGGSLAAAIKSKNLNMEVVGYDIDKDILKEAEKKIVHKIANSLEEALENADFIILATPVDVIIKLIPMINKCNPKGLISDVGSCKKKIIKLVNSIPDEIRYVSLHPLAGTEKSGPSSWNCALFEQKPFFIIPTKRSRIRDIKFIDLFIRKIGAIPYFASAKEHDEILSYTSHLPYLISLAIKELYEQKGFIRKEIYIGPAFKSMTRIAESPASVMKPIIQYNRKNIQKSYREFIKMINLILLRMFKTSR